MKDCVNKMDFFYQCLTDYRTNKCFDNRISMNKARSKYKCLVSNKRNNCDSI
jgi:hypothetical protein